MNPFAAEHEELRDSIRRFVANELRPHAREWEDARWFPNDVFTRMGELGFLGLKYPEEYGGQGGTYLHDAVLTEELSRSGSGGLAAGIGAHIGIATPPVWKFGTEDQKQRYLAPAIRGEKIAALGITEPDAGSDVAGMRTKATKVEAGWTLSGSKMFITNGVRADFVVCAARTTAEGGHHGISFFLLDTDQPGYEASKIEKLGWHASDTALISLDECFVPEENMLGGENEGFKLIMANFQWERLLMSLGSVSAMQVCFDKTVEYVAERTAFGRPIGQFQVLRHRLADHYTTIHAARTVTYDALARFAAGEDVVKEVTMAKLITQRNAYDLIDDCLQMHGGAGYMEEYDLERAARDSRLGPIGGGTDEIMREILSKTIGL
jgi:alkylation response protein AidB-like acyl-CoA dehydrogenase